MNLPKPHETKPTIRFSARLVRPGAAEKPGSWTRLDASNSGGTTYGADVTFTTSGGQMPPTVATEAASQVTTNAAVLNGLVNPNGAATTVYFQWGTDTSYGNLTTETGIGTTAYDDFQASLTNLNASTIYHYQIVAVNSGGTSYGADATFQTPAFR